MLHLYLRTLVFLIWLLGSHTSLAQVGWKWGRTSTHYRFNEIAVATDKGGNVYVCGDGVTSVATFNHPELTLIKADSSGNHQWTISAKTPYISTAAGVRCADMVVSESTGEEGYLYILGVYKDSLCVVMGDTLVNPGYTSIYGDNMYFVIKCSAQTGNVIWVKNVARNGGNTTIAGHIGVDQFGDVVVAGGFMGKTLTIGPTTLYNADTTEGYTDIFLAKFTNMGTPVWCKSFGGRKSERTERGYSFALTVTKKGSIYLSGQYNSPSFTIGGTLFTNSTPHEKSYLAKFDRYGNVLWAQAHDQFLHINKMVTDDAENIFLVGCIDSTVTETFGIRTVTSTSLSSVFYARFDSSGAAVWAKVSGRSLVFGYDLSLDQCGNIWLAVGRQHPNSFGYADTLSIDGNLLFVTDSGGYPTFPLFLVGIDTAGNYKKGLCMSGGGWALPGMGCNVCVDNRGSFYASGNYFNAMMTFGSDTLLRPQSLQHLYFARYKYETALCKNALEVERQIDIVDQLSIYPNPAGNECTIHYEGVLPIGSKAELYDLSGRFLIAFDLSGNDTVIPLPVLSSGVYLCRISIGHEIKVKKITVIQ